MDLKKAFLDADLVTRNKATVLFGHAEPYERLLGRDLCHFSSKTMQDLINTAFYRYDTLFNMTNTLQAYLNFCKNQGIDDVVSIKGVPFDGHTAIQNRMALSPADLQKRLDGLLLDVDEDSTDIVLNCMAWMAFGGISFIDMPEITNDDVDIEHMTVYGKPIY